MTTAAEDARALEIGRRVLAGARRGGRRHAETERPSGAEIDYELEFDRLLHGQINRALAHPQAVKAMCLSVAAVNAAPVAQSRSDDRDGAAGPLCARRRPCLAVGRLVARGVKTP
jgi:hypothetical protein